MHATQRLVLLALCHCLLVDAAAGASGSEDLLMTALLQGYEKDARPPPSNQPTDVHISLFLSSIDDVEEHLLTITASGYVIATWSDSRLAWNATAWNGLDRLVMAASSVWKPDFALTDAVGDVFNSIYYADYYGISLVSTGNLSWTLQGSFSVRCDFNLSSYPFDKQTCDFRFESFNYPSYLLHLFTDTTKIDLSQYHENSEFSLTSTAAVTKEYVPEADGSYSNVIFTVSIKRRELYFMLNMILPCTVLAVLTCFVYLLPVKTKERVGLAITVLLAFSVFQLLVAGNLPMNSLSSTILTDFILTAMFFNSIALIVTIFELRFVDTKNQPLPPLLEKVFLQKLGVLLRVTPKATISSAGKQDSIPELSILGAEGAEVPPNINVTSESSAHNERICSLVTSVKSIEKTMKMYKRHKENEEKWNAASKVLDVIMFILFLIAIGWLCITSLALIPARSS